MGLLENGKRKLTVTIGSLAVVWATATVGWLFLDKMDASQWSSLITTLLPWLAGIFTVGNAFEHLGNKLTSNKE
jgi:TctA family transporter